MNLNDKTVIVRQYNGIGIDSKLNGWNLKTETMVKRKFYNGRICYADGDKRVGLRTLKNQIPCRVVIDHSLPF